MKPEMNAEEKLKAFSSLGKYLSWIGLISVGVMCCLVLSLTGFHFPKTLYTNTNDQLSSKNQLKPESGHVSWPRYWMAPDTIKIQDKPDADLIRYGRNLIVNTASYLGPKGTVGKLSNGMNCQNCHLDAGTRPFANNFSVFYVSYPKWSARKGRKEKAFERIDECFERSMNGIAPKRNSKEMQAMLAYLKWVGEKVNSETPLADHSVKKVPYLDIPADPIKGKIVYTSKCMSCHGGEGKGMVAPGGKGYIYPPLWGPDSYNDGAGMFRLGNFAGFVKNNMPYGSTYQDPILSDEEAWNVAAFVNSQPRHHLNPKKDYKDVSTKPIDYPFGPYADAFSEKQHKYGPFSEIAKQHPLKNKKIT